MTIRVAVRAGSLVPLDPVPADWSDGRELILGENGSTANVEAATHPVLGQETDGDVEWLTDEEYERFKVAIEEADREAKAWMRREMGII